MASDLLKHLLAVLNKAQIIPIRGYNLLDWRISLSQTQMVTLGIKDNIGGSVYTPPAYKSSENAEVFLVWEDGKCSRAKVQRQAEDEANDWSSQLTSWRIAAFEDPYATRIPAPAKLPDVQIQAEEIRNIIEKDISKVFDQQGRILSNRPKGSQTSANIRALWAKNNLHTSTGIEVDYCESRYAISWSFDSQISEGFAKRRLITDQEWEELWRESISKYHLLSKQGEAVNEDTLVVLAPSVMEQMLDQYILPNFRGENILEGQSRFGVEDFAREEEIFNEGLTLDINPLRPYSWESYLLTAEGVPATRTQLVSKGKLHYPYLNVKDANRWGVARAAKVAPTAIPYGAAGIMVQHSNQIDWSRMLEDIENGVLILSVLGLHTQNPVTGSFSLAAPSALRIKNGRLTSKTDVRINGNIWDILKSGDSKYGKSELDRHPYLLIHCQAENL